MRWRSKNHLLGDQGRSRQTLGVKRDWLLSRKVKSVKELENKAENRGLPSRAQQNQRHGVSARIAGRGPREEESGVRKLLEKLGWYGNLISIFTKALNTPGKRAAGRGHQILQKMIANILPTRKGAN